MSFSIPSEMTYIRITEPGNSDVLQPARMPTPQPGDGEVLIQVGAAGVNRPDIMQRMGLYPPPASASPIPGLEVAGVVVACGHGVTWPQVGAEVCALVPGGGYAEYCITAAPHCLPIPKGLNLAEASAIPETFFTVWSNLFERGRLTSGETVLIHGGSSGIGTTAIQLASQFGAHVATTAGTKEKLDFCQKLGAELAINYREEDFTESVMTWTSGRGVDVILDFIGGDYVDRNLLCIAIEGRLVQLAFLEGSRVDADFLQLMARHVTWTGSMLRPQSVEAKAHIAKGLHTHVWPLIETGKVRSLIYKEFALEEASAAHLLMESNTHMGKIVLTT